MTRYGFAIKALPKGKPFGDDDEDQDQDAPPAAGESDGVGEPQDTAAPKADQTTDENDPAVTPLDDKPADAEEPVSPDDALAPPPADNRAIPEGASTEAPPPAPDDARPWSGDLYDEGDETDPAAAFAAYKGAGGEEAWLNQAPDGTLTGWVRDATGQVWRYNDPDVWAIDVDDAQMTRTHSQANGGGEEAPADYGGQDPLFPPKQSKEP